MRSSSPSSVTSDAGGAAEAGANFEAGVGALRGDAGDADGVVEQRVVEGHFPPDHRRQRIMRQDDPVTAAAKQHGDGGSNLVGAEDHGKSIKWVSWHFRHFSGLSDGSRPAKQEPGRDGTREKHRRYQACPAAERYFRPNAAKLRQVRNSARSGVSET